MSELTERQSAVLEQVRLGKPNKLIAVALNMEVATVKSHMQKVLRKLGVSNRTQAALIAQKIVDAKAC